MVVYVMAVCAGMACVMVVAVCKRGGSGMVVCVLVVCVELRWCNGGV